MRKKIFGVVVMAAIAAAASWNFNQSKNEVVLTDLALANVEALARGETSDDCYSSYSDWCDFVVSTPGGNHIESHPYLNERP